LNIMKITKDMSIGEVIGKHPEVVEIFLKNGLGCVGCGMAQMESVEEGAKAHGIDVKKLVEELNKAIDRGDK